MIDTLHKKYGLYTSSFFANLYNSLKAHQCGGQFSVEAAYRCKKCNAPVSLEEIKKQIDYKGVTPGIAMDNIIDSSDAKESIWKKPEDIKPLKQWWKFW